MISVYDRVENIVGKGENAGYQYFLLFPKCFQRATIPDRKNQGLFGKELKLKVIRGFECFCFSFIHLVNSVKKN